MKLSFKYIYEPRLNLQIKRHQGRFMNVSIVSFIYNVCRRTLRCKFSSFDTQDLLWKTAVNIVFYRVYDVFTDQITSTDRYLYIIDVFW